MGGESDLEDILKEHDVGTLYLCGLALDFGVGLTALGAVLRGFDTYIIEDATRAVTHGSKVKMKQKLI